mmetsp:Transcript_27807/g.23807  ORF Transcript_27807/g.23807 Transcript_27807/m.23807 type:complete len:142 (-) Transcript_27807:85-510(-)
MMMDIHYMVACAVDVVPCYGGRYSSRESYDGAGRGIRQLYSNLRELVYSRGGTTLTAKLFGHIDRYAYWFVDLLVGSPQQRTSLIVDTGSTVPAFTCEIEDSHVGNHIDPHFNIKKSIQNRSTITSRWCHSHYTIRLLCIK